MKISEVIKLLKEIQNKEGDISVTFLSELGITNIHEINVGKYMNFDENELTKSVIIL